VDSKYILGGQANIWTEQIYNTRHLQYMVWPRALAIAESVWSPAENKNWKNFVSRVEQHQQRFCLQEIKYAPSMYDPIFEVKRDKTGRLQVLLSTEVDDLSIHYSFDNSFPDNFYPRYTTPLTVPDDAFQLRVITYRGNTPVGRMNTLTVEEMRKRAKPQK
jgi:hexosaminidase